MYNFDKWRDATGALPWGAQKVLHDTLSLVADGKVTLVHGSDYSDGRPCLINAAATMLSAVGGEGGEGKPTAHFNDIVGEFDRINRHLVTVGINKSDGLVSPLAAEVLVHNFAPLKEKPVEAAVNEATSTAAFEHGVYREPSDEELMRDWLKEGAIIHEPAPLESDPQTVAELEDAYDE